MIDAVALKLVTFTKGRLKVTCGQQLAEYLFNLRRQLFAQFLKIALPRILATFVKTERFAEDPSEAALAAWPRHRETHNVGRCGQRREKFTIGNDLRGKEGPTPSRVSNRR